MAYNLVSPPSAEPVTLAEIKRHVRAEDFDDDDTYLTEAGIAARKYVEAYTGKVLAPTTFDLLLDAFPRGPVRIEKGPLASVASVKYVSAETGLEVTLSDDHYQVDAVSDPGWIAPYVAGWPSPMATINSVRIRFVAGYSEAPQPLKRAICELVSHWYENREATSGERLSHTPLGLDSILTEYREWTF